MSNAMGCYTAEKVNIDGSRYYFMSNKPIEMHDGEPYFTVHSKVWKISGNGFALCQDAGLTDADCVWTSGWDDDGNAVVNVLSAIGITFDWAKGGTLKLGGVANGNGLCEVYDEDGNVVVRITNNGITMYRGLIQSPDYLENSPVNKYSQRGMMIDVVNKIMKSPYFSIDTEGAYFKGTIEIRGDIELGTNSVSKFVPVDYYLATDFEFAFQAQEGYTGTSTVTIKEHRFHFDSPTNTWVENTGSPSIDTYTLTDDEKVTSYTYDHELGQNGHDYIEISSTSSSTITISIFDSILAKIDDKGFHGVLEGIFKGRLESDSGKLNGFNYGANNGQFGNGFFESDDGYEFNMRGGFETPNGSYFSMNENGVTVSGSGYLNYGAVIRLLNREYSSSTLAEIFMSVPDSGAPEIYRAVPVGSGSASMENALWRNDIQYSDTDLTAGTSQCIFH